MSRRDDLNKQIDILQDELDHFNVLPFSWSKIDHRNLLLCKIQTLRRKIDFLDSNMPELGDTPVPRIKKPGTHEE